MYGVLHMALLDEPEAKALLADADVSADDVRGCHDHITRFLKRYLPLFYREEQRGHAAAFVRGLLSGLQRKSVEPIAAQAGVPRKDLQYFVGCGGWDDDKVMAELRRHVREELADEDGVIFVPATAVDRVVAAAEAIRDTERAQADRSRAGDSLRAQLRFSEFLAKRDADPSLTLRQHLTEVGGAIGVAPPGCD